MAILDLGLLRRNYVMEHPRTTFFIVLLLLLLLRVLLLALGVLLLLSSHALLCFLFHAQILVIGA